MAKNIFVKFEHGELVMEEKTKSIAAVPWVEHKDFAGVFLKNVITGDETRELFSCHLVRIEPNMTIGMHAHPTHIELHEIIEGGGVCRNENREISYSPGTTVMLACNSPHEVRAGDDGLCLFAKFISVSV